MYEETRVRLAKALRRDRIPDPVWDNLLERDLVQDYEKGEFEWEYLVDQTRFQLKAYNQTLAEANVRGSSGTDTTKSVKEVEPELGAYEEDRAEAMGKHVALQASLDPHVRYFRKIVLAGELLNPEQACTFVRSAANQCFDIAWFIERQIPIREHYSHVYSDGGPIDEDGVECRFDDISADPQGGFFPKVTYEPLDYSQRDIL